MIISLTGTPGTGKTSIASLLKKHYTIPIINLHQFAKDHDIIDGFDKQRQSDIIEIERLNEKIQQHVPQNNLVILDGHLSHLLSCISKVIVLRCHPIELQKRLQTKQWSKEKINENIHAEILDIILSETVNKHPLINVFEINTSKQSIDDIAQIINQLIQTNFSDTSTYSPGIIDWSELLLTDEFSWSGDP